MAYILMAKRSILRKVGHCLSTELLPKPQGRMQNVPQLKPTPNPPKYVTLSYVLLAVTLLMIDQRIGELVTVHIKSYDEMKRTDCLICSIPCEGLEQYSKDQDSSPTGIPLQVQEGIVQLHIGWEHPDYLKFFTNAGTYEVCFDFELFWYKRTREENLKHCCRPAYNLQSTLANNFRKPIPMACIWPRK